MEGLQTVEVEFEETMWTVCPVCLIGVGGNNHHGNQYVMLFEVVLLMILVEMSQHSLWLNIICTMTV